MSLHERRGFVLCWAASKRAEWKTAIIQRLEAICPGEPVIDDAGRFEPQAGWRKALAEALPKARAILLVIEPRSLLRAQIQPPGYDCVDELVPREIHRLLEERAAPIVPLLVGTAEWPNSAELPPELRPLMMRRAVNVPILEREPDFSAIDARIRDLAAAVAPALGSAPPRESLLAARSAEAATPFVRNRWRMFWLQHRIWVCLAAALLIAAMAGVGVLALQQPAAPSRAADPARARGWRATTVREALVLSPADLAGAKRVLIGEFQVSAARGDGAVLRPLESAFARNVRIDARFANERVRPAAGSIFRATPANALVLRGSRRGADGQWTLTVRAAK